VVLAELPKQDLLKALPNSMAQIVESKRTPPNVTKARAQLIVTLPTGQTGAIALPRVVLVALRRVLVSSHIKLPTQDLSALICRTRSAVTRFRAPETALSAHGSVGLLARRAVAQAHRREVVLSLALLRTEALDAQWLSTRRRATITTVL